MSGRLHFCLRLLAIGVVAGAACVTAGSIAAQSRAAAPRSPVPGAPAGITAFIDVNVVPMDTERMLESQTVLVQNGWITALGPMTQVSVPTSATHIAGHGKFLIPGLADMHVHFAQADSAAMAQRLFGWLADGITVVRSMDYTSSAKGEAALRMRSLAAAGTIWSPRLYVSAPWAPRQPSYMRPPDSGLPASALDSVAAYVAEYKAQGYDHIKLYHEHGEAFDSLISVAQRMGVSVVGHVPRHEPLRRILPARVTSIEHLTGYHTAFYKWVRDSGGGLHDDSTHNRAAAALAEATRRAHVWNTPTTARLVPALESRARSDERLRDVVSITRRLIKALQDTGPGLLLGTDDNSSRISKPMHREMRMLLQMGLTPYQILMAGTRNVATYYGTLDESGTVAVGKRADLVLLTGDPLQDIRSIEWPAGVMIGGRWLSREEIDRLTALTAPE